MYKVLWEYEIMVNWPGKSNGCLTLSSMTFGPRSSGDQDNRPLCLDLRDHCNLFILQWRICRPHFLNVCFPCPCLHHPSMPHKNKNKTNIRICRKIIPTIHFSSYITLCGYLASFCPVYSLVNELVPVIGHWLPSHSEGSYGLAVSYQALLNPLLHQLPTSSPTADLLAPSLPSTPVPTAPASCFNPTRLTLNRLPLMQKIQYFLLPEMLSPWVPA